LFLMFLYLWLYQLIDLIVVSTYSQTVGTFVEYVDRPVVNGREQNVHVLIFERLVSLVVSCRSFDSSVFRDSCGKSSPAEVLFCSTSTFITSFPFVIPTSSNVLIHGSSGTCSSSNGSDRELKVSSLGSFECVLATVFSSSERLLSILSSISRDCILGPPQKSARLSGFEIPLDCFDCSFGVIK
uniref:Secreted protein n=1 Tax=Brugia timori TaxID=42155 RepID=A0A0R3Q7T5_9BILA